MNISKIQKYNIPQTSFGAVSPKFKPAPVVVKDKFTTLGNKTKTNLLKVSVNIKNTLTDCYKSIKKVIFKMLDDLYNPY